MIGKQFFISIKCTMWLRRNDYPAVASFIRLIPTTFTNQIEETFCCDREVAEHITQTICCEECFRESTPSWKNYLVSIYNTVFEHVWQRTRTQPGNFDRLTPRTHEVNYGRLTPVPEENENQILS